MKRLPFLIALLTMPLVGIVMGQNAPEQTQSFTKIQEIGRPRPQGIQYDSNFDRFVMTKLTGSLLLVDALTLETQHILYEQGFYNTYKFSHDGRYLALAIDRRIELWDTQTGQLSASLEPEGVLSVTGPLHFADDDALLLFDSVVPAPAATRRSENDTSIIPWLWDLPAARNETNSTLPGAAEAYAFFNFRTGLVLGPNDTLIAALPGRLQVIDGRTDDLPVVNELVMNRLERDPMSIWRSLRDDMMYVRPNNGSGLIQLDTRDGSAYDVPVGRDLIYFNLESVQGFRLSRLARVIGEGNSLRENSLLRLLFGGDYRQYQGYQPTSIMLLDILQPLTVSNNEAGLLIYTFYEQAGRGVIEFIRPPDIVQMELNRDNTHLMVRRVSGLQPIEIYNLDTGILERTYFPAESDFDGTHTFAFKGTGDVIVTDFQRFDVETGAVLLHETDYTNGFQQYFFTDDSRQIVTLNGSDWRLWDIETGALIRREQVNLRGSVYDQTPDAQRFLTQFSTGENEVFEIVDVSTDERRTTLIPRRPDRSIETIIPSDDWQNYLVVYAPAPDSGHYPGNEIAIHNSDGVQTLFLAGDDLPPPDGRGYGWQDNGTVYVSSFAGGLPLTTRIYGLDYHPSGLPACLVEAYPEQWSRWVNLWEQLNYRLSADELGRLTQRLCAGLPANADAVVPLLTPTPQFFYRSDATPVPLGISGVPICLTSRSPNQALDYAADWREMSAGLSEAEAANLAQMLCEGLVGSLSQVQPTPTVDPNQFNPPTATPVEAAPESVESADNTRQTVMLLDIHTGERLFGSYLPSQPDTSRSLALIYRAFEEQFHFQPSGNVQRSPDGTLLAMTDQFNFIQVYRLAIPYDTAMLDATATALGAAVEAPRTIGLAPTATKPFDYAGGPNATLTPTITPTPPPAVEAPVTLSDYEKVEDVCPARRLYDIAAPPPDYAATGRLFVPPLDFRGATWVLEADTGRLYPDDRLPTCGINENCQFSFDQSWILRQDNAIHVSRPDGSAPTVLFEPEERPVWPGNFNWIGLHTLQYLYEDYIPDRSPNKFTLLRFFDPGTATLTDPILPPDQIIINDLPTSTLAEQPVTRQFALVSTDYGRGIGQKYYIYDRETGSAEYFARVDYASLEYNWHPLGRALYYRYPSDPRWFIFDPDTRQHRILGHLPRGTWSRDGRYIVDWVQLGGDERIQFQAARQLLPKISVWDSETGLTRRYCIPESGDNFGGNLSWSPDNRYLTFRIQLPPEGDTFPTFYTVTPEIPPPTATPVPLETQYQLRNTRTLVLDTQTGSVTVLSQEAGDVIVWTEAAQ